MSFRIRPKRDFSEEFKRVACQELAGAIADLEEQPNGPHAAIHAMRKRLKRIRSLYRLVAHQIPDLAKRENRRLRDNAKSLSAVRDATAMIEVVTHLQQELDDGEKREALSRIISTLSARRDRVAETEFDPARLPETIRALKEASEAVGEASFDSSHRKNARMLAKAWAGTGRKAVAAIAACKEQSTDDDFHELRKRSYDYRLNHLLLRDVWPSAMKAKHDAAKALIERLGIINDISVLSLLIDQEPDLFSDEKDRSQLLDTINATRQPNREAALAAAESLFGDKPNEESERIELLWVAAGGRS